MSMQANSCATWVPTKRESQPPSPLFHSLGTTRHATARTSTRSHRRDESFNGDRNAVSESRWSRRLPYGHASSSSNTGSMPPKKLGVLARRSRDFVDSVAALGMTTLVAGRMRETQRFIVVDSVWAAASQNSAGQEVSLLDRPSRTPVVFFAAPLSVTGSRGVATRLVLRAQFGMYCSGADHVFLRNIWRSGL